MMQLDLYDEKAGAAVLAVAQGTRLASLPELPEGDWEWVGEMTVDALAGLMDTAAADIEAEVAARRYCLWE